MMSSASRPARELGDLVRVASPHRGPWPKLSVWHGSADRTVHPGNAGEIVKQWLDLHGLDETPMSEAQVNGYPRQVWWNADGETVVESYTISGMAHGTPLGVADNDERYGTAGAFLIEAGISSSYHIAKFFGLTSRARQAELSGAARERAKPLSAVAPAAKEIPERRTYAWPDIWSNMSSQPRPKPPDKPPGHRPGVSGIIHRALTAAGLKK
jgi:hypothetical protein